jgi:hypothetical protein
MQTVIDKFIEEHQELSKFLDDQKEVSLKTRADDEFKKVLILSISSFFEREITEAIMKLAKQSESEKIVSLVQIKAISRQYHTYFAWDKGNINSFLRLFGKDFKDNISQEIENREDLKDGAKKFLELGNKRNILVHSNFASATIEWTLDEVIEKYRKSWEFVNYLTDKLVASK